MSNSLAIATVTEAFRQILDEAAAASGVAGARATTVRPITGTAVGEIGNPPSAGVNLFLYQVVPDGPLTNMDLPTRRSDGSLRLPTRSAYNLNYLLTFYGVESDLEPQRVMGNVLRVLHSLPVITRKRIENVKLSVSALAATNLETEIELVKVAILPLNLEELSKLWSVFFQTTYNLSIAFQAGVIFLDGQEVTTPALPVRDRKLYVSSLCQPVIQKVLCRKLGSAEALPNQAIEAGDTIVLLGRQLGGNSPRVQVGGQIIKPTDVTDERIEFPLATPPFASDSLRAGVQGLQVVQLLRLGTPESDHAGSESNVEAFVLHPKVAVSATPVSNHIVDGVTLCTNDVTLDFVPPVGALQRVKLLLNQSNPPPDPPARAYQFDAPFQPPNPSDTYVTNIVVRVREVAAGDYLARVQVDGAESVLATSADPDNPLFVSPKVTIA
jgi:hypothetical protein